MVAMVAVVARSKDTCIRTGRPMVAICCSGCEE